VDSLPVQQRQKRGPRGPRGPYKGHTAYARDRNRKFPKKLRDFTTDDWKQRIYEKCLIHPITGCWIWQNAILKPSKANPSAGGYGMMYFYEDGGAKMRLVHNVTYTLWVGPIPAGRDVCHHDYICYSKACCNPDHLYAGTTKMNINDAVAKGFIPFGGNHKPKGTLLYLNGNAKAYFFPGQQPEGWTRSSQDKDYGPKLYGNGVEKGIFKPGSEPAGWVRLWFGRDGAKGSKWYTDGVKNTRIHSGQSIPEGWHPGHTNWNNKKENKNGQVQH
jgi:hypothetical protein